MRQTLLFTSPGSFGGVFGKSSLKLDCPALMQPGNSTFNYSIPMAKSFSRDIHLKIQ